MTEVFMGNALWHLIKQLDFVSKSVLLVLLFMSVICWTIFLYKMITFYLKKKHMQEAIDHLKKVSTVADLVKIASDTAGTMPGYFFANNLSWVKDLVTQQQEGSSPSINWDLVNDSIGRTVDTMTHNEESYLSFLSTSAAVSPLLGLFGTVWGLVHSFVRISQQKTADIAVVAPGIAEALITTLAGLVVAIPALIIFSYVRSKKDMLQMQIMSLADLFGQSITKLFS